MMSAMYVFWQSHAAAINAMLVERTLCACILEARVAGEANRFDRSGKARACLQRSALSQCDHA